MILGYCNTIILHGHCCLQDKCHQYWPSERSARYQYFVVDPMAEYNMPQYILREFKVTDARDGQSRTIRQFQFTDWPEQGVPKSGEGFIDFIGQVHKTKEQFGQDGPITVHCRWVLDGACEGDAMWACHMNSEYIVVICGIKKTML
jgi:protein tyrosine phosphatase